MNEIGKDSVNEPYKLPDGWRWVRLGEISKEFVNGGTPDTSVLEYWNGEIPWITGADVTEFYVSKGRKYITEAGLSHSATHLVPKNTVLVVTRTGVGKIAIAANDICFSQDITGIICGEKTEPEYLARYILSRADNLASIQRGATIKGIIRTDLENLKIPLPPLSEQRRIASKIQDLMQEVERAQTACEKQLEAARALPSAYLREIFESEEAKKWERKRLGEVLETVESGSRPKGGVFEIKEGVPSIGAEHLNSFGGFNFDNMRFIPKDFYEEMNKGKIQRGDVLVVKDGATTGKVSFVGMNFPYPYAAINEHVFRLRGKKILDQGFLFWFLYSPSGQTQIQQEFHGSAQGGINQQFVNGVQISFPFLQDQKHIVSYLKEKMVEVEKLRRSIEKQLEAINALPQAILRKAFRGEL